MERSRSSKRGSYHYEPDSSLSPPAAPSPATTTTAAPTTPTTAAAAPIAAPKPPLPILSLLPHLLLLLLSSSSNNRPHGRRLRPASPSSSASSSLSFPAAFTTSFRILCPDSKAAAVVGRAGAALQAVRRDTAAWVAVHQLAPGDDERVVETADDRRREPDGRPRSSPPRRTPSC
uniref:K Homology domain-containing protein n=1 Tax=Ananas comosus var. bracteatus TaxID=296719 RepID=A0A6V7Q7Q2_ANACO|nr:unnamed protein product [Ananas comosus var. bracteatus]